MEKKIGIYPGSFDPITNGHFDIIQRASRLFDQIYVVVSLNIKKEGLFSFNERLALLKQVTKDLPNVEVDIHDGLIINYALEKKAKTIIRGLRAISDYENEFKIFSFNRDQAPEIDTVILLSSAPNLFLSSSAIKELAKFGGNFKNYVPQPVYQKMLEKYQSAE